jgi:pimeloyl-ACP methyl ester carboxylesterase
VKVEAAGVELAYEERGAGDAIVLVHGIAASARDWDVAAALPGRVVAYDRRGYGASGAPEPYGRTTVGEQAEDLAALVRTLRLAPALLVGADLGALICLDVLLRHRGLARGAVLLDPPLYAFVPEATEALSQERARLEEALRSGGQAAGVAALLGDAADPARRDRATVSANAVFADYGAIATLALSRRELRALDVPVRVVTSPDAPPHVAAAADALLQAAPGATRAPDLQRAVDQT